MNANIVPAMKIFHSRLRNLSTVLGLCFLQFSCHDNKMIFIGLLFYCRPQTSFGERANVNLLVRVCSSSKLWRCWPGDEWLKSFNGVNSFTENLLPAHRLSRVSRIWANLSPHTESDEMKNSKLSALRPSQELFQCNELPSSVADFPHSTSILLDFLKINIWVRCLGLR